LERKRWRRERRLSKPKREAIVSQPIEERGENRKMLKKNIKPKKIYT